MIVAHLFTREEKHKVYLMCETTATEGLEAPYASPEHMFEIELDGDPAEWRARVVKRILAERPDLEFEEAARPKRRSKSRPGSFDLIFRRKAAKKPSLLERLVKGKK